jgi:hypothetical protein
MAIERKNLNSEHAQNQNQVTLSKRFGKSHLLFIKKKLIPGISLNFWELMGQLFLQSQNIRNDRLNISKEKRSDF